LQLQQISDVEDKWKKEKEFSIPVIVPLTNLASRINTRAGKELVKIITTSDFNELPENVNKNANGFIYNGVIYINASRAKMSDLPHELGHLFLGMMKAANMETYM
jgi:Zn-dependent peptidase ImmA (M78 family)